MEHGSTQLLSLLISYYLPIKNELIKMQVGFLLSALFYKIIHSDFHKKIIRAFYGKNTHVIVKNKVNGRKNPIYDKLEDYIIDKYIGCIKSCELIPKKGNIIFQINNNDFKDKIKDNHDGVVLNISFCNENEKNEKSDKNDSNNLNFLNKNILIESKHLTQDQLKSYVINICNFEKSFTNTLTVWRTNIEKYGKNETINWEETKCQTNSSIFNFITA